MGEKGEGSGGEVGGKWGERGRELGMGYPLSTPSGKENATIFFSKILLKELMFTVMYPGGRGGGVL